jgi:hypothetical protein
MKIYLSFVFLLFLLINLSLLFSQTQTSSQYLYSDDDNNRFSVSMYEDEDGIFIGFLLQHNEGYRIVKNSILKIIDKSGDTLLLSCYNEGNAKMELVRSKLVHNQIRAYLFTLWFLLDNEDIEFLKKNLVSEIIIPINEHDIILDISLRNRVIPEQIKKIEKKHKTE